MLSLHSSLENADNDNLDDGDNPNHNIDAPSSKANPPRSKIKSFTKKSGFSLVELLVTISIAAILLTLAAPSFTSFINKNRLATASDELITSLSYARSEALKRRSTTTLCAKSSAGTLCDTTGVSEDYATGWLVFLDCNNNNAYDTTLVCDTNGDGTLDSPDELLRLTEAVEGDITISGDAQHTANIQFGLSGRVLLGAASFDIQLDGTTLRTLEVNRSGSAYFD